MEIAISNQDKICKPSYSVEIGSRDRKSRPESNMEPFWYLTGPEIDKFKQNLWNKHPKISIGPNFGPARNDQNVSQTWTQVWSLCGNSWKMFPKWCRDQPRPISGPFWKNFPWITKKWLKILMIDQLLSHFLMILGKFFQND